MSAKVPAVAAMLAVAACGHSAERRDMHRQVVLWGPMANGPVNLDVDLLCASESIAVFGGLIVPPLATGAEHAPVVGIEGLSVEVTPTWQRVDAMAPVDVAVSDGTVRFRLGEPSPPMSDDQLVFELTLGLLVEAL